MRCSLLNFLLFNYCVLICMPFNDIKRIDNLDTVNDKVVMSAHSVSSRLEVQRVSCTVCTAWSFTVAAHWKVVTTQPVSDGELSTSTQQRHFYRRSFLTVRE